MTPAQKRKFEKLAKDMRGLLEEMEQEHPDIQIFIEDGVVYLMDWPCDKEPADCILVDGGVWPRSGGGAF